MVFLSTVPGKTEIYEIFDSGTIVGIVWRRDGEWLADPFSMSQSLVYGTDRETIAHELAERLRRPQSSRK